ncbi:MAG: lysylphosphatidylglycerol synthase transmembrane domain-containing protein [Sumerlaeia bacterium]
MKKFFTPLNVIALIVSAFFLFLAFRKIDFSLLGTMVREIQWVWALPLVGLTWISFYWRAWRWKVLLSPYRDLPLNTLYGPLMVGFAFNNILPARAGEIARPLALQKVSGIPFATAISSVVLERVCDMIVLLALFAFTLVFMDLDPNLAKIYDTRLRVDSERLRTYLHLIGLAYGAVVLFAYWWGTKRLQRVKAQGTKNASVVRMLRVMPLVCALMLILGLTVWVFLRSRTFGAPVQQFGQEFLLNAETFRGIANKASIAVAILLGGALLMIWAPFRQFMRGVICFGHWLPGKVEKLVLQLFDSFAAGFDVLSNWRLGLQVMGHTAAVWFLTALPIWLMAFGVPGLSLSPADTVVFLVVTCIVISLPAAPGFWGVYELGGLLALIMVGVVADTPEGQTLAVGFTLVVHFVQWALVTVIGLYYAAKIQVSATDVQDAKQA